MASYGRSVQGVPPSLRAGHRRAAAWCAGRTGHRPCTTTTLAYHFGAYSDPEVSIQTDQIADWIALHRCLNYTTRVRVRKAWLHHTKVLSRLPSTARWQVVAGPLGATVATLLQNQWHPSLPTVWLAPDRVTQAVVGARTCDTGEIIRTFQASVARGVWARAAGGVRAGE